MKRIALAFIAALALCSCSSDIEESSIYEEPTETETEQEQFTYTGIPEIPAFSYSGDDTAAEAAPETGVPVTTAAAESVVSDTTTVWHSAGSEPTTAVQVSETPPEGVTCLEVPYISQQGRPAGCELASASMLLAYYDFTISPDELISEGYVDSVPVDLYEDAEHGLVMHGGDPNKAFIGDPSNEYGYGCYSGAILTGLRRYLDNEYFDAVDISGISLKDLCMEYIDFGEPVIIWASVDMEPTFKSEANTWIIDETGETFTWTSNEHCCLLVGYDEENYCFHDPLRGAYALYPRADAEARYREMGSQAITIHPW